MDTKRFALGFLLGLLLGVVAVVGYAASRLFAQPDITLAEMGLQDLEGRPVPAARLVGRPVVVNYWATWCKPCIEEFPDFAKAQAETGPGVELVMISDEPAAKIRGFLKKHPYPFTFWRVRQPLPDVMARPCTYAFSRKGQLVKKKAGTVEPALIREFITAARK
ncbi:hypothetical protein GCM10023185_08810 [Hymenobacter saemangeumensis]|uniref:Thioredoxin domain-containing protein n=1 Tax=Hymenobacter saemangeumensis TaxID=1084522 RepID=A0ABP8I3U3_9BACT